MIATIEMMIRGFVKITAYLCSSYTWGLQNLVECSECTTIRAQWFYGFYKFYIMPALQLKTPFSCLINSKLT